MNETIYGLCPVCKEKHPLLNGTLVPGHGKGNSVCVGSMKDGLSMPEPTPPKLKAPIPKPCEELNYCPGCGMKVVHRYDL